MYRQHSDCATVGTCCYMLLVPFSQTLTIGVDTNSASITMIREFVLL